MIKGASVNIFDFMTPAQIADTQSGSPVISLTAVVQAAIDSFPAYLNNSISNIAGKIVFPFGKYYFATSIVLDSQVTLSGFGAPAANVYGATQFLFADNIDGIVVNSYLTDGAGKLGGAGTIIENISFLKPSLSGSTGSGIYMKGRATVRDCLFNYWKEYGIRVDASNVQSENANSWHVERCRITNCGSHGLYVNGPDVNAGTAIAVDSAANGGYGFYDSSFFANTYIGCHADNNALGAYRVEGGSNFSVYEGCYSEAGQPASVINAPAIFTGGLHASQFSNAGTGGAVLTANGISKGLFVRGMVRSTETGTTNTLTNTLGSQPDVGTIIASDTTQFAFSSFKLKWTATFGSAVRADFLNSDSLVPFYMTAYNTTFTGGKSSIQQGVLIVPDLYIGQTSNVRQITFLTAAPTTGDWARGDKVFNSTPAAGQPKGWVCTVTGTPGTWVSEGNL
jgi:hypothetical protein